MQNLAEDVVDILDALSVEKAHFCGISMGGITGLWLAIHHPERFLSITVANSAAKIGQAEAWLSRAESVEQNGLAELVKTTHTRWFSEKVRLSSLKRIGMSRTFVSPVNANRQVKPQ